LRVHLDLLLAEHVMIVAKESEAALYHSDEYAPYTTLLGANNADLSALLGRALGPTTSTQFTQLWSMQNGYLVDYAIGVVTHDDDKANAAMTGLRSKFVPQFGQLFDGIDLGDQVSADKAFIDDVSGQRYAAFYTDLDKAYMHTSQLGDALARHAVAQFPDRFPGNPSAHAVEARIRLNLLMQEHSYLATMATDAAVVKRDQEQIAAVTMLAAGSDRLGKVWSDLDAAVVGYARGSAIQESGLVNELASATGAMVPSVQHLVDAIVRVVDDQKLKSSKSLADDDRAAATAMQPIADSVQG
jgi:hypothetical protein